MDLNVAQKLLHTDNSEGYRTHRSRVGYLIESTQVSSDTDSASMRNLDSFEKSDKVEETYKEYYESYYNRTRTKEGSLVCVFSDMFGYNMADDIAGCMKDFYDGKIDKENVKEFFEDCCKEMRIYMTQTRRTSGQDIEDNGQIVSQVFEMFCKENQRAALYENRIEGEKINQAKYPDTDHRDYAYYNSDYYYKCEDMRESLRKFGTEVADKWEIPEIDFQEVEKNTSYMLDGGLDFNSGWNFIYRNNTWIASIADENMTPPRNFSFYYNAKPYANGQKNDGKMYMGVLEATCGSSFYKMDVPFQYDAGGKQIFRLDSLVSLSNNNTEEAELYREFFKNFSIFTHQYGINSGIRDKFGNYQNEFGTEGNKQG